MKRLLYVLFGIIAVSCSVETQDYISIGYNQHTISYAADTFYVNVKCSSDWEVNSEAEWISVEKKNADTAIVAVSENITAAAREAQVFFSAKADESVLTVEQLGASFTGRFEDMHYFAEQPAISKNGRYIAGMENGSELAESFFPVIIDTYTGEKTRMEETWDYRNILAISNDASTISFLNSIDGNSVTIWKDGQWIVPDPLYDGSTAYISDMSSDGSVWVGYITSPYGSNRKTYLPARWINGEPEVLALPDNNLYGTELYAGGMARGCSSDGSVIYGSEWDTSGLVYWKNGEMHYPAKDYHEVMEGGYNKTLIKYAVSVSLSSNGKYIATVYTDLVDGAYPTVYDTEECKAYIIDSSTLEDGDGITVDNNGLLYAGAPLYGSMNGYVCDYRTQTSILFSDWAESELGLHFSDNRMVYRVSEDGNVYFGAHASITGIGLQLVWWYLVVNPNI